MTKQESEYLLNNKSSLHTLPTLTQHKRSVSTTNQLPHIIQLTKGKNQYDSAMSLRKRINNSSSYRVIIGAGSRDNDYATTMDANSTLNKNISTLSYSKKSVTDHVPVPRKREYRLYSIRQTTVTVPAALLKVEHEYFHTVRDQEKIITD